MDVLVSGLPEWVGLRIEPTCNRLEAGVISLFWLSHWSVGTICYCSITQTRMTDAQSSCQALLPTKIPNIFSTHMTPFPASFKLIMVSSRDSQPPYVFFWFIVRPISFWKSSLAYLQPASSVVPDTSPQFYHATSFRLSRGTFQSELGLEPGWSDSGSRFWLSPAFDCNAHPPENRLLFSPWKSHCSAKPQRGMIQRFWEAKILRFNDSKIQEKISLVQTYRRK